MKYVYVIVGSLLTVTLVNVVLASMSIPDVQFSYSTDECVHVQNFAEGDTYSCDNLPLKFNHVWVQ